MSVRWCLVNFDWVHDEVEAYRDRPGFTLVSFRQVGLPFYRVHASTLELTHDPMPVLQEFVLRCIDVNLCTQSELAGFLGLESEILIDVLYSLKAEGFITIRRASLGSEEQIVLTQEGAKIAESLRLTRVGEGQRQILFDGTIRRCSQSQQWLEKPKDVRETGLLLIDSPKPGRPLLTELTAEDVTLFLISGKVFKDKNDKILEVTWIHRSDLLYKQAMMLCYISTSGNDIQFEFIIDGKLSGEHGVAFAASGRAAEFATRYREDTEADPLQNIATELLSPTDIEVAIANADANSQPTVDDSIRLLETYDHPPLLVEALEQTRRELIIFSPWLKNQIVTTQFVDQLRNLLEDGVSIWIGYGFGDSPQPGNSPQAVSKLEQLDREYAKFRLVRLGDTHAKVLLFDDTLVITSFNWLSFSGDPTRTFRDERGLIVRKRDVVEKARESFLERLSNR